ncbi:MAG: AtpZ/AtpI family protein [bacterium]
MNGNNEKNDKEKWERYRKVGIYTGIPWIFVAGVGVGYFIGSYLEKVFKTGGILLGICMMVGVGVAFYEIFRMVSKEK